jgi:YVTN family beta-propeller protein
MRQIMFVPVRARLFAAALLSSCALLQGCVSNPAARELHFDLAERSLIGGQGGWDFITFDAAAQRLFIARSDRVQVWSASQRRLIGEIGGTAGVHGVALAPGLERAFTSNGASNSVTVFSLHDLKVLATIPVPGSNPDAILFEPKFARVYTFNGRSHDATVIDARTMQVIASIPLAGKPEVAVSDAQGNVYVNIEDTSELARIDPVTNSVVSRWPLHPCEEPTGLAIDTVRNRLFSVCANRTMVISDPNRKEVVASVPIGAGPDGVAFDPALRVAISANGEGTLTVVGENGPSGYRVVQTVQTEPRARTLALDQESHRVYLVSARFGPAPAATIDTPHPRPSMLSGSFEVLAVHAK